MPGKIANDWKRPIITALKNDISLIFFVAAGDDEDFLPIKYVEKRSTPVKIKQHANTKNIQFCVDDGSKSRCFSKKIPTIPAGIVAIINNNHILITSFLANT